ncbi:hypothetical protein BLNAU_11441 [Blattamonas nauphoetae]|uniref:Uncharacterized protein n=1 Tax=Blattamonas nauphoetae TaxID=2049346 RepID=A0ABQ9XRX8_9EUKA|nr:hypothetical protein BLNAU_11441 [Blattamonas nauphoetae]
MTDSLKHLRNHCEEFVSDGWLFFETLPSIDTDSLKSSVQTIVLDNPSFTDLILNSLKLNHKNIKMNIFIAITNIGVHNSSMREQFMKMNLVSRMFETVDFVSLPLSESNTLFQLTNFLAEMFTPIGDEEEAWFRQYPLIRVSVFEPAKQFLIFMFHNWDKLILNEEDKDLLEGSLCWIHRYIKDMELLSDEHDPDIVSELVKWEVGQMVEMENEEHFEPFFGTMLDRTQEWNQNKRERQKRREVVLREEGWDDVFELRVVGIDVDTDQERKEDSEEFRIEMGFKPNRH